MTLSVNPTDVSVAALVTKELHLVDRDRLYRRIAWRLIPFLILCYIFNAIDRTNVGMAQLRMEHDLGFTAEVYGVGVGVFYIGYVLCEVPSNLLLQRIGLRKTLLRIMVGWGVMSSCTMLVQTPLQFYIVRFLLGIAEAGFYPGIILFLTYWFPPSHRGRMAAMFLIGSPLASAVGSPLSGALIASMDGVWGWHGWQWMFLLEGLPAVVLGLAALFCLTDRPSEAKWLSSSEKAAIEADFSADEVARSASGHGGAMELLRDPQFYILGIVVSGIMTLTIVSFWTPLLLKEAGVRSVTSIGALAALPPLCTIIVMNLFARHSDKYQERRWHLFAAMVVGAVALLLLATMPLTPELVVTMQVLTMVTSYSGGSLFTAIYSAFMPAQARAAGIAILTSFTSLAAAVSPIVMGYLRVATGTYSTGLLASAAVVAGAAALLILGIPKERLGTRRP